MANQAFKTAVKILGGQSAMARILKVKPGHVWYWLHKADKIPGEIVIPIEKATEGKVTRQRLRPDLYPKEAA